MVSTGTCTENRTQVQTQAAPCGSIELSPPDQSLLVTLVSAKTGGIADRMIFCNWSVLNHMSDR